MTPSLRHRARALATVAASCALLVSPPSLAQDADPQPVPPQPMTGWLADFNAGAVRLDNSDLRLAADARLGYGRGSWGIIASGAAGTYDEDSDAARRTTSRLSGAGEGWLLLGGRDAPARMQLRASGGGASYDSTYEPRTPAAGPFTDQTSWMGRGTALAGLIWRPSAGLLLDALAGAGVQVEWYDLTTAGGTTPVTIDDTIDTTARGEARLEVAWAAVPSILSLRLRGSTSYFKLSRDNEFIAVAPGTATVQTTRSTFSQLEASGRGFVELDAAQVAGILPTLHAGVDYVRLSGDGGALTTLVPVFGAGLLHPWW